MKPLLRRAAPLLALLAAVSCGGGGGGGDSAPPVHPSARLTLGPAGEEANGAPDFYTARQSSDGRYVAFISNATNLTATPPASTYNVYLRDVQTGATTRIGANTSDFPNLSISADGRYVALQTAAAGIAVYDRVTQVLDSTGAGGIEPAISADGRYVAFATLSALEPSDHNGEYDIYVYDKDLDTFTRVSETTAGAEGDAGSDMPAISGDGRYVAFRSWASDLVTGDTNGVPDTFLHDRNTGITKRISLGSGGAQMTGPAGTATGPGIDYDGSTIVFNFEKDAATPGLWLWSGGPGASAVAMDGIYPSVSTSGRYAVYSDGLVLAGNVSHVYVVDLTTGATRRLTYSKTGGAPNGDSFMPSISGDGNWIVFQSKASNLMDGDTNGVADLFRIANPL